MEYIDNLVWMTPYQVTKAYDHTMLTKKQQFHTSVIRLISHVLKLVSLAKAYALDPSSPSFDLRLDDIIAKHKVSERLLYQLKGEVVAKPCELAKSNLLEKSKHY